jgi:hypothetical protein
MSDAELERRLPGGAEDRTLPTVIEVRGRESSVPPPTSASGRKRFAVAATLVVLAGSSLAAVIAVRRAPQPGPAALSALPQAAAGTAVATPITDPIPEPQTKAQVATHARALVNRPRARAPKPVRAAEPVQSSRPERTSESSTDCTPPYTIDARGDKHYKRQCL